jgi:hypothetical protein
MVVLSSCAADPIDDDGPVVAEKDNGVIAYAPNGLPIVEAEVLPYVEPPSQEDKASIEPFVCTDELGANCRKPRGSWTSTDLRPSQKHTFWGTGSSNYIYSKYEVRNIRNQWYTIQSHPAVGGLNWWFEFPLGHSCRLDDSYNPQNCTWDICLVSGTPWPRCISTNVVRGSTFAFNGESWSPYETLQFEVFMTAWGGWTPATANFEQLIISHNDITQ